MVENAGDIEAKASLQPPSYFWEIDFRNPKGHRPSSKKNKKDTQYEHRDKVSKKKAQSQTLSTTN